MSAFKQFVSTFNVAQGSRKIPAGRMFATAALFAVGSMIPAQVRAANTVSLWVGSGTTPAPASGNWSAAGSWSPVGTPVSSGSTELDFGGTGSAGYVSNNDIGPFVLNEIQLNSSATVPELIAAGLPANTISFANNSTGTAVAPSLLQNGSGAFNFSTGIVLSNNLSVAGTGTGALYFSGPITGAGAFTSNVASATFLGTNAFTGSTNIAGGLLNFGATSSASAGGLNVGTVSGFTAISTINSTGILSFTNGNIAVGGTGSSGAIVQNSGTVNTNGGSNYLTVGNGGYGSYVLAGGSIVNQGSSGMRVGGGNATGQGVYTQTNGSLTLQRYFAVGASGGTGVATFLGGTALTATGYSALVGDSAGTAVMNIGTEAGGTAVFTSQASAGLQVEDGNSNSSSSGTLNLNSGTLLFKTSGINRSGTGNATLNLNGGTLQAGASGLTLVNSSLSSVNVYNGGLTVDTQAFNSTLSANLLATTGNGLYPKTGGTGTLAVGSGGTGYIGAPIVTVTDTTNGGATGATAIANVTNGIITGVTLTSPGQGYQPGDMLNFSFAGGGTTNAAPTFVYTIGATDSNIAANGLGGMTKIGSGTLTVTGSNTYTGTTAINAGTLAMGPNGTLGGNGPVAIATGAALSFTRTDAALNFANSISGAGSVVQAGSGTTTLVSASTYTGATSVNLGKLVLAPTASLGNTAITVASGATLSVQPGTGTSTVGAGAASLNLLPGSNFDLLDGSIGTTKLVGTAGSTALTVGSAGGTTPAVLTFELGQSSVDELIVTGSASQLGAGGTIVVSPLGSDSSLNPGTYTLISAGGGLGTGFTLGAHNVIINGTLYDLTLSASTDTAEKLSITQDTGSLPVAYWNGAINGIWSTNNSGQTNWRSDYSSGIDTTKTPDSTTNVFFTDGTGGTHLATTLGQDTTINSLNFDGQASGPVSISGNTLTINALPLNGNSTGNGISVSGGPAVTINSAIVVGGAQTWTNNGSNPLIVNGNISGAFGISYSGGGPLVLAGSNSFSGGLTANGGSLALNNASALGTGPFVVAGSLNLDNTSAGPVTLSTNNAQTWNGDITFTGTHDLNMGTGTVTLGGNRTLTLVAGNFTLGGTVTDGGQAYTLSTSGNGTLNLAGNVSGTTTLSLAGPGTVYMTGTSNYSGATLITGGTLNITGSGAITGGGQLNVGGESGTAVVNINTTGTLLITAPYIGGIPGDGNTSSSAAGVINQTAGVVSFVGGGPSNYIEIGSGPDTAYGVPGGYGSYNISGGTITTTNGTSSGIRVGAQGIGFLNVSGTANIVMGRYLSMGLYGTGTTTVTGGTITGNPGFNIILGDHAGTGILNIGTMAGGNGLVISQSNQAGGGVAVGGATSEANGILNLNSGILQETNGSITTALTSPNSVANGIVNLNGGTIQAGANNLTLISSTLNVSPNGVFVYNGNAVIDTQTFSATVSANLQPATGNGLYPSSVATGGPGILSVPSGTGGSGYIGQPLVTATGGSGTGITAIADITNGVVTGVTLTSPGQGYQPGDAIDFAFSGGGTSSTAPDFVYTVGTTDPNLVANNGGFTKLGSGSLTLSGTNTYTGPTVVSAGTLVLSTLAALPANTALTVGVGAKVLTPSHGSNPDTAIALASLTLAGTTNGWTGSIDLSNNDLIVHNGSLAKISNQIKQGYNIGGIGTLWSGPGISSSAAANDTTGLTALGVLLNNDGSGSPLYTNFDGQTVNATDVLVKYTYYGDANLDGHVDGSDYTRIDNGFNNGLTGWGNGDFNYDGVVNGSDYTLIDNAFNTQGSSLEASALSLTASPTGQIAGGVGSAVPEPASLALISMGTAGLLTRRRRRN